jgi:hypothetical protein
MTDHRSVASMDSNGRVRIGYSALLQIIVYVITLTLAYSTLDKRIARLEDKYDRIATDLAEIRSDVKQLLRVVKP